MPNDLSVQPAPPAGAGSRAAAGTDATPAASRPSPTVGNARPNPSMRIDPALGLVVIEFRDTAGRVTEQLPDPRQLDAYRVAQQAATKPISHAGVHQPATRPR